MSNAAKPAKPQAASTITLTLPLLLEIGCEEIPARFLAQAQKDLGDRLKAALEESRLLASPGGVGAVHEPPLQTFSTPRRLVSHAPAILERQPDKTEEITGPPVKVAVDAQGKYTRAAESFARKNSVELKDLIRVTTPKGEHLAVKKTTLGRPAVEVLGEIVPPVITGLSFPKSMYWTAQSGPRFVRPIRWILALLGERKNAGMIPFEIAGVKAGDFTFGHRTVGQNPVRVSSFKEYVQKLNQLQVELEPEKRRERVRSECKALLEGSGLRVVEDKALEDWIVNSTEWPRGLVGNFEERFLGLPREILVTVMRDHQKYFAVEDAKGNLRPQFVASLNREGDPHGLIKRGHERVLTARFSDAEFFWNADQKIPLRDRLPMLERVTYQAKLGTYADKVRRMEAIARQLCATLVDRGKLTAVDTAHALRAVQLCKCDLTTQMVQEFTELQGIVGGLYAKAQGEPQEVADAIYDHYLPQGADDKGPRSLVGAVVSLTDKLDTVVQGFWAGLKPKGSSDPFGLRRAGNGIVKIVTEMLPGLDLDFLANEAKNANLLQGVVPQVLDSVIVFFRERVEYFLREAAGLRYDTARALIHSTLGWTEPAAALLRGKALERIRDTEDFVALSQAAKRTRNILSKSAAHEDYSDASAIDAALLTVPEERALYDLVGATRLRLKEFKQRDDYEAGFRELAKLRTPVDRFFDKVMVMDEDRMVRVNRLRLLAELDKWVFRWFADLSQIESSTSIPVGAPTSKTATETSRTGSKRAQT